MAVELLSTCHPRQWALALFLSLPPCLAAQGAGPAPYALTSGDSVNIYLSVTARNQLDSVAQGFRLPNGSIFRTRVGPPPGRQLATAGPNFLVKDFNRDGVADLVVLGQAGGAHRLVTVTSTRTGYQGQLLVPEGGTGSPPAGGGRLVLTGRDGFELVDEHGKTRFSVDQSSSKWLSRR